MPKSKRAANEKGIMRTSWWRQSLLVFNLLMPITAQTADVENALTGKLENALSSLQKNHPNAAIMKLQAFIDQIEAQRGEKITESDADYLMAEAQSIIQHI